MRFPTAHWAELEERATKAMRSVHAQVLYETRPRPKR